MPQLLSRPVPGWGGEGLGLLPSCASTKCWNWESDWKPGEMLGVLDAGLQGKTKIKVGKKKGKRNKHSVGYPCAVITSPLSLSGVSLPPRCSCTWHVLVSHEDATPHGCGGRSSHGTTGSTQCRLQPWHRGTAGISNGLRMGGAHLSLC